MGNIVDKEAVATMPRSDVSIATGAIIQAIFTFLSRMFGMVREVIVFHFFGATGITDSFLIAFTIPNVLRRFFGEGALGIAFVPVYIETKERQGVAAADRFFRETLGILLVSLAMVTIIGIVISHWVVYLFAFGFSEDPSRMALTTSLTRWLFPYVFLVSIVALLGAYLQCYRRFAAMAAAPILLNLAMVACLAIGTKFGLSIYWLVLGVQVGGVAQVLLMMLAVKRAGLFLWPRFSFESEALTKLLRLLGPALFGVFVYQLNIVVLRQLASFLGEGQIAYYYTADRLTQVATGVFAASIANAVLPELSLKGAQDTENSFMSSLRFSIVLTSYVVVPSAIGLMVFSQPIIAVLYMHGAFSAADAMICAKTLVAFSPSVVAFGLSRPFIQAFYALGDTKTPVKVGVVTVLVNLIFGLILLPLKVVGLALTLSISSFVQYLILYWLFRKKFPAKANLDLTKKIVQHVVLSIVSCASGYFLIRLGDYDQGYSVKNAVVLAMAAGVASLAYLGLSLVGKLPECRIFFDSMGRRFLRK